MSALPPKADIGTQPRDVRFVPKADITALFERKDALPIVLHADHRPAALFPLIVECLGKGADLRIGKPLRRAISVFALRIVMQDEHHQPSAFASTGVLQHLLVTSRVAKGRVWTPPNHQVNALGLSGIVVV